MMKKAISKQSGKLLGRMSSFRCSSNIPFYGRSRSQETPSSTTLQHQQLPSAVSLLLQSALTALRDPTRADAVATVGELTGTLALKRLLAAMQQHSDGQVILRDRPLVSKETIPYNDLLLQGQTIRSTPLHKITFGQAYGAFLQHHGFDPDERDSIKYIADPDLAYVMLRYRQNHDFFHTLTQLPPTVLGELGLKWLELFQTGLPLAALSGTIGSFRLESTKQREILFQTYLPWASRVAQQMEFGAIMMVCYEQEFETPIVQLRERLNIEVAPQVEDKHAWFPDTEQ
jgi:ubiquinone biosynthesis protein COQ4